jgi:hypothetical protein
MGSAGLRPEASNDYVYPPHMILDKVANLLDYQMVETVADDAHNETREFVKEWQRRWHSMSHDTQLYRRIRC